MLIQTRATRTAGTDDAVAAPAGRRCLSWVNRVSCPRRPFPLRFDSGLSPTGATGHLRKLPKELKSAAALVAPRVRSTFMNDGWDRSASSWIAALGERGDWGREHVLDPIMLKRASAQRFKRALDVGCGEGRFCRMLRAKGIPVVGIDPTEELLAAARRRDSRGEYQIARAESLPFPDASFDLVVSYLTLIDIADFRTALKEMVRVLVPQGNSADREYK
jgi:predicted TPR repeat methyltransferase